MPVTNERRAPNVGIKDCVDFMFWFAKRDKSRDLIQKVNCLKFEKNGMVNDQSPYLPASPGEENLLSWQVVAVGTSLY